MRVGFVGKGALREFKNNTEEKADVLLFGFDGLGVVNYEKELKGESGFFEEVALLSKLGKCAVVCGCVTDTRGHKRKSVVVAENGRLLGVSDMLNVIDGEIGSGAALKLYDTKVGKMGVVVADDLYFPDVVKSLAVCGCDFIACPFGRVTDSMQSVLLRAYAYCYGIPILFCGCGYCSLASADGNIAFASPLSPVYTDFENVKEFHLVEMRRRGRFRPSL